MNKPLNTVIPAYASRLVTYDPGVPVYTVKIFNQHHKEINASVSYDRATGVIMINMTEAGG